MAHETRQAAHDSDTEKHRKAEPSTCYWRDLSDPVLDPNRHVLKSMFGTSKLEDVYSAFGHGPIAFLGTRQRVQAGQQGDSDMNYYSA